MYTQVFGHLRNRRWWLFLRKRNRFRRRKKLCQKLDIVGLKKRGLGHSWRWDLDPGGIRQGASIWKRSVEETSLVPGKEEALRET